MVALTGHKPQRRCRVCRTAKPKTQLQRWVKVEGRLERDNHQNQPGRGYYTCREQCAELLPQVIKKTGR